MARRRTRRNLPPRNKSGRFSKRGTTTRKRRGPTVHQRWAKASRRHARVMSYGSEHRPRLRRTGRHTFTKRPHSPYRIFPANEITRINPYMLKEVGMLNPGRRRRRRHSRNPSMAGGVIGSVKSLARNPVNTLLDGSLGALSAALTISVPNAFLPFAGSDLMSRVLRLVTRVAAGGLVTMLGRQVMPRSSQAIATGAAIGAIGGSVFDFLGTTIVIGAGDTAQTPGALLASVTGGFGGVGAYARPMIAAAMRQGVQGYAMRAIPGVAAPALRPGAMVRHNLGW